MLDDKQIIKILKTKTKSQFGDRPFKKYTILELNTIYNFLQIKLKKGNNWSVKKFYLLVKENSMGLYYAIDNLYFFCEELTSRKKKKYVTFIRYINKLHVPNSKDHKIKNLQKPFGLKDKKDVIKLMHIAKELKNLLGINDIDVIRIISININTGYSEKTLLKLYYSSIHKNKDDVSYVK